MQYPKQKRDRFLINSLLMFLIAISFSLFWINALYINETTSSKARKPLLIGHRGAPAYRPEHTIEGYKLAISLGADYIEPDLVFTKDGHLIARHENEISSTTDVADRAEFKERYTTKLIDGTEIKGYFTEDFTLQEIQSLFCRERIPKTRPNNTVYNDKYKIPTFEQVIELAIEFNVGIYPETKHPSYFESLGLFYEEPLLSALAKHGLDSKDSKVFIQSFEVSNLKRLSKLTTVKLVQLLDWTGTQPYDFKLHGINITTDDMLTLDGLHEIKRYADVIAPYKEWIIPRDKDQNLGSPSNIVTMANSVGLDVHIYTFRPENVYLPTNLRKEGIYGDSVGEIIAYLNAGIDGFFDDSVKFGRCAVDQFDE
jgi:glycerophosphoryl diester phosphodiesterase